MQFAVNPAQSCCITHTNWIQIPARQDYSHCLGFAPHVGRISALIVLMICVLVQTWSFPHLVSHLRRTSRCQPIIQENAKCISKPDLPHDRLSLCPVTRFQQDELHELIERMMLDAKLPRSVAAASFISMRLTWALAFKARYIVRRTLPLKSPGTVIKT